MEKDLEKIAEKTYARRNENEAFRMYLKSYNHQKLDELVHKLNQKYNSIFDCTECGNCCKKLNVPFQKEELEKIAGHLQLSYEKMKEKYVDREIAEGFLLKGEVCPFLKNNKCTIYEYRSQACRSFPHLYKDHISNRLYNIIDNSSICPILYNVIEDLKEITDFKSNNN